MNRHVLFAMRMLALVFALATQASTLYWDGGATDIAANGNGVSAGAAGTWDSTLHNWDQGVGLAHAAWNSAAPDSAVLGGLPGLVTLGASVTAGSVTLSTGGYILDTGAYALTLATLAGAQPLTKTGNGTVTLSGTSPYAGVLTVNDGLVELANGASLASAAGIFLKGGAGTVGGTNYPFKGVTRGGVLFLRDDTGRPGGAQLGGQPLTLDNGTLLWQSGYGSDFTALSTVALVGGFNSIGVAPVENPDVLKIGNLIRTNSATVEFRAAYHRLGTGEVQIQIASVNGAAIANVNGILGGWAFVAAINTTLEYDGPARDFAKWDPAAAIGDSVSSIVAATPDKANGGGGTESNADLAGGTATENWLINNGSTRNAISADTTIYSLIEEADLVINNGATLTLASGGLICRNNNFWMQTHSGATGYLTSGLNDLYVQTDGGSAITSDQAIKSIIKDGPAGAVTLRKSGSGKLKLDQINTFSGGTVVNQGTLDLQGGGTAGCIRGAVTVNPGAVLQLSRADATGWQGGSAAVASIHLNGGNLNVNIADNQALNGTVINMTGASITGPANGNIDFYAGGCALNTLPAAATSTISGVPLSPVRQGRTTFTVSDGPAAIDLDIASVLRSSPSGDSAGAVLIKSGSGTMRLSATNTLASPVSVSAGTLLLGPYGSLAPACAVTVASGATLGGDGTANGAVTVASSGILAPGGVGAIGTLTLANNSATSLTLNGGTVACDVSNAVGASDLIAITGASGTLVLNGANALAISLPFGSIPAGTYTLMTYAAKSGSGTLSLTPAIRNAALTVGDTSVTLTVAAGGVTANALVWRGDDAANAWDTSTANWLFNASPTAYSANEAVLFDDTGSGSPSVNITPNAVMPGAVTVNNTAKNYTIGGSAISGGGSLTKAGAGTLTLTGVNTFTGPVAVNAGTLEAAAATADNPSALGGGANVVTVANGARLLFTGDRAAGYHTGAVTVNGGTITGNGSDLNFAEGTALTFDTAPGVIDGTGLWRRRAANNAIAVTPAGSGSTISIAELNLLEVNPVFDVADGSGDSDLTVSSMITGDRVLIKQGTGKLTLAGANTYSGGNELLGGTVSVGAMSGFGSGYIAPKNGTVIEYTGAGSETRSGAYWFDWAPGAVLNIVNPAAALTLWRTSGYHNQLVRKTGAGTLRYGASSDNPNAGAQVDGGVLEAISSANNNFGYLTVNAGGTFRLGTADGTGAALSDNHQLWDSAPVTVNAGGTFSQNGMNETIGTLNLNGGAVNGLGTLTVATAINASSGAAATSLGGAAGLTKSTAGTLTLSGANSYGGATAVSGGTLLVNGSHTGGNGYTVANATLGGTGSISLASGSVSVQAGGALAPGATAGAGGTLTLSALSLAGATVAIDATADAVAVTGSLTMADCVITVANIASFNKDVRYPVLTYGGTATGTPVLIADDSDWFIKHRTEAKTYYLRTSRGNGSLLSLH